MGDLFIYFSCRADQLWACETNASLGPLKCRNTSSMRGVIKEVCHTNGGGTKKWVAWNEKIWIRFRPGGNFEWSVICNKVGHS